MDSINMIPVIVFFIGWYVFYESFTAINEMEKTKLRHVLKEFKNPYTLKYWGMGLYALGIILYAKYIIGWNALLVIPAVLCVMPRTFYRAKHFKFLTHMQQLVRFRYFLVMALSLLLLFVFAIAKAEEPPKSPEVVKDCDFIPERATTSVHYDCNSKGANGVRKALVGEAEIVVYICGKPYSFDLYCPPAAK